MALRMAQNRNECRVLVVEPQECSLKT